MKSAQSLPLAAGVGLLCLLLGLAYGNHFHNDFHFDDSHTIVDNLAIRDLRNIPSFFTNAATFSALPSNQSYRPLVTTLLAVDYRLAGGLRPFWFHVSSYSTYVLLCLLLAYVIARMLRDVRPDMAWPALAVTAVYAVHPANADTVNYIIACADILSTLGVIAAFAIYYRFPRARAALLFALPAALAILAKPTAIVFPLLLLLYHLILGGERRDCTLAALSLLPCAAAIAWVHRMTPPAWVAGAIDARAYLMTQPYVALLYLKTFFWPDDLSADYDLSPFGSIADPRFAIGIGFLIVFLAAAIATCRYTRTRLVGFGLLWYVVALLPTALFPLAEVMNDHRASLAYIGLAIALAGGLATIRAGNARHTLCAALALVATVETFATSARNTAWATEQTLWRDVTLKSPRNGRGLMNYGNTLMAAGDFRGALGYFHRALVYTPQYPVLFVNLAIAENATGDFEAAERHFREALRLAPGSPTSYTFYARHLLDHGRPGEARALLDTALSIAPGDSMAHALDARLGPAGADTPESLLSLSLSLYRTGRYQECIAACRRALALRPGYAEAWNNIGSAYNELGRYDDAIAACTEALRLRPGFDLARNNLLYAQKKRTAAGISPGW